MQIFTFLVFYKFKNWIQAYLEMIRLKKTTLNSLRSLSILLDFFPRSLYLRLKVVGNENGGGSGLLQMFDTKCRTVAIDIYLPFEHAGFVYKSNFRFCLL